MQHRGILGVILLAGFLLTGCGAAPLTSEPLPPMTEPTAAPETAAPETEPPATEPVTETEEPHLATPAEIGLCDPDGDEIYSFTYRGEAFQAEYTPDNWKIRDSYRITDAADITVICQALSEVHPIHGADLQSWRTPEDMAYEWEQHNLAYAMLPDDSPWKDSARDVDLDPKDQGKSVIDFYNERQS